MTNPSTPRRRWRRTALATAGISLIAAVAPMISASPAGAAAAPTSTTDAVGIRIDENAILGPALELIEDSLQPFVNQKIYEGALANSVMDDPDWVQGSATLELSFDFINAGTTGYPQGGLSVQGDLTNIMMRFYRYGAWWQPECQYRVNPDPGWIKASAKINSALLPAAPLQLNPITAYWDTTPTITREIGPWTCDAYLFDEWWDGLWGTGTDVADQLEAELNGEAQDLVNDLWTDHVMPLISSLSEFGVSFNQIRTDTNGLIVTVNSNLASGLTIPGMGGPYSVAAAEDSGVTNSVNTVLANRGEVIVSVHPNLVNQFLTALNTFLGSYWGADYLPTNIESTLFGAPNPAYRDDGWYFELTLGTGQPHVKPTGTGGAPQLQHPHAIISISHEDTGLVATYEGAVGGINLKTVVRADNNNHWGPDFNSSSMTASLVKTYGPGVTATGAAMLPTAKQAFAKWNTDVFETFINFAPVSIGGLAVNICTTCTRYAGDQRYTEVLNIA